MTQAWGQMSPRRSAPVTSSPRIHWLLSDFLIFSVTLLPNTNSDVSLKKRENVIHPSEISVAEASEKLSICVTTDCCVIKLSLKPERFMAKKTWVFSAGPVAQVLSFMLWLWSLLMLNQNRSTVSSLKGLCTGGSSYPDYWDKSFLSLGTELLLRTLWLPEWGLQTQGATGLRPAIPCASLAECLGPLSIEVRSLDPLWLLD